MTEIDSTSPTVIGLRRGILSLGALSLIATGLELALEQHWKTGTQRIPWISLIIGLVALILLVRGVPSRRQVRVAQLLAILVAMSAAFGVFEHIATNYEAAPLDYRYADTWEGLSEMQRLWIAATHQVGPSPTLAPLALAYGSFCVLIATYRHPSLSDE